MYLLDLAYRNLAMAEDGRISLRRGRGQLAKWTLLGHGEEDVEVGRLIALAGLNQAFLHLAAPYTAALLRPGANGLEIEWRLIRHPPRDCGATAAPIVYDSTRIAPDGEPQPLDRSSRRLVGGDVHRWRARLGSGIRQHLTLAYGPRWAPRIGEYRPDFPNPQELRFQRIQSAFDSASGLTDAPAFLQRLQYRKQKGRQPAIRTLDLLARQIELLLEITTGRWLKPHPDFQEIWAALSSAEARILLPIIDAVRHATDASPHDLNPLARAGVTLLLHPQRSCPTPKLAAWFELFDRLFPAMQFVVVLSEDAAPLLPPRLLSTLLPYQEGSEVTPAPTRRKAMAPKRDTALLIDVDGRIPNLALLKLGGCRDVRRAARPAR